MIEWLKGIPRAQREFKQIVKKHGPWVGTTRLIHDLPYREPEHHEEHEPVSLIERVKLITAFNVLQNTLRSNMIYGDQENPYHLIGVIGNLHFRTSTSANGEETIEITRRLERNTGLTETEYFAVSNEGSAQYMYRSVDSKEERQTRYGTVHNSSAHNKDLVIDNVTNIAKEVAESINNPDHSPYQIRQRVREIRKELLSYFKSKGIVPQKKNSGVSQNITLPNLYGIWSVQFDDPEHSIRDSETIYTAQRAKIETHGTVLILTNEIYDESRALSYSNRYVFCENGDLEVAVSNRFSYLDSFSEEGKEETGMHDPHFALVMAQRLGRQIVRKPTETELAALKHDLAKALK